MSGAGESGGSIKLTVLVAILAIASNFGWAWVGMSREDSKEVLVRLGAIELHVAAIQATIDVRTPVSDRQITDLDGRLRVLEARRRDR